MQAPKKKSSLSPKKTDLAVLGRCSSRRKGSPYRTSLVIIAYNCTVPLLQSWIQTKVWGEGQARKRDSGDDYTFITEVEGNSPSGTQRHGGAPFPSREDESRQFGKQEGLLKHDNNTTIMHNHSFKSQSNKN